VKKVIEKKEIELKKGREVVARLDEIDDPLLSARQFIVMHFDAMEQSGKSLKAMHVFLRKNGIDVGTYTSFRTVYSQIRRARKTAAMNQKQAAPQETPKRIPAAEKPKSGIESQTRPRGLELTPIRMADGTEVLIDPATGARHFKI
jgi:hypothetical protein